MTQRNTQSSDAANPKLTPGQAHSQLASNPETLPVVLVRLSEHEHPNMAERVAENPRTPPETLQKLSTHESADVRIAVTENANTPAETLQELASDENPDVRLRLAENPNTPVTVLETLTEDENPFVYAKAKDTLETCKSILERADEMFLHDRFNEAEQLYKKLVEGVGELLGSEHIEMAKALHKLAASLGAQNKIDEAAEVEECARIIKSAHKAA